MVGLKNCATVDEKFGFTDISINLKQVFNWNPDYILLSNISSDLQGNSFEYSDTWQSLPAIQQNKILRVPNNPFNWIGRPPSINRFVGIRRLIHSFYPNNSIAWEVDLFHPIVLKTILTDKKWETLSAILKEQVYAIPTEPFC